MKILVTGATGYVGGRLVPELLKAGHDVRTTKTSGESVSPWWSDQVETVEMDVLDKDDVDRAVDGVDAIYYLIHGMGGDNFVETDRKAAELVAAAIESHNVSRVVYLSGIVPDVPEDELSDHITSRLEVERILSATPAIVITLRAAVLLGSASTSFEIIRQVSERMPVQTVPEWMDSQVQPIAVVDALQALVGALTVPGPSRHVDVGGPDQMRYAELLDVYADVADLERPQLKVPFLPTALVGALVATLIDVPKPTVEALVESLHHDMVSGDDTSVRELLPQGHRMVPVREAIERSLATRSASPQDADPMGPLPHDPPWAQGGEDKSVLSRIKDALPGSGSD
ncbi:NAD(P)H-binding protein [Yimella sp. cx-51]|uniref:NAD(P)H-binding protein n=1 Tax=Yimella sp. cx-51 TaxID=2770551 RepID=UPI001CB6C294|nr:NAD(P)H-binding protein [Yimella sp. cx-51]